MLTETTDALSDTDVDILDGNNGRPSPFAGIAKRLELGRKFNNLIADLIAAQADIDALPLAATTLSAPTELTISAGGVITITQNRHTVDTNADAASDELDTISGGEAEQILVISPASDARDIVINHGAGNIVCPGAVDITLAEDDDFAMLYFTGTVWVVLAYKVAALAAATQTITDVDSTITATTLDGALTELSRRVRAIIATFTATASAEALNVVTLTLNLVDLAGTPVSRVQRFRIELFGADMVRLASADFTMAVTTGTIQSTTAKGDIIADTDASGDAVVTITDVGGGYNGTIKVLVTPIQPTGTYAPATPVMTTAAFDAV